MNSVRYAALSLALGGLAGCSSAPSEPVGAGSSALLGTNALDPTFGHGGLVTLSGSNLTPTGNEDLIIQPDGKIVIGTRAQDPVLGPEFAVVRLLTNGTLDATFGTGGVATTPYPGPVESGFGYTPSIALQSDGKIVATNGMAFLQSGAVSRIFSAARFNSNGTVDTTFGTRGVATATLPGTSFAQPVVILVQPDHKILVAGSWTATIRSPTTAALVRFNANGSLDTTFGTAGIVASTTFGQISALALEPDVSILALSQGQIARFSPTGASEPVALVGTLSPTKAKGGFIFTPDGHILGTVALTAPGLGREGRIAAVEESTLTGGVVFTGPAFKCS